MPSICIFGDSIGEGYYDSKMGGWVAQLSRFLQTPHETLHIYNCSISGDSTREVLHRFDTEVKARMPSTIIFALGTNDSWYFDNDKNKPNVSLEMFTENITLLLTKAQQMNATVFCLGAPKVDEAKVMPIPWRTEVFFDNENIKKYNDAIKSICTKRGVVYIDTYALLEEADLYDGLHPNTQGHLKIFDAVKNILHTRNIPAI